MIFARTTATGVVICLSVVFQTNSFQTIKHNRLKKLSISSSRRSHLAFVTSKGGRIQREHSSPLYSSADAPSPSEPQIIVSGISTKPDLLSALSESVTTALSQLPPSAVANLCLVTISSLYDSQSKISSAVSSLLAISDGRIESIIGCTAGGIVGSNPKSMGKDRSLEATEFDGGCLPFESEGVPACSVTLFVLPDVDVRTFHVENEDVPDYADAGISPDMYKNCIGLRGMDSGTSKDNAPALMLIPSPAFQNELDDFLRGLDSAFPYSTLFGGVASTVSSLSRARLFRHDPIHDPNGQKVYTSGCIGVSLTGDIEARTMVAQGAKPVGGVYRIVTAPADSSIGAIMLDENSSEPDDNGETENDDDDEEAGMDKKELRKQMYAKARMPKPVLAEANFLMKTLSDDDQGFMKRALLVGIDSGGAMGRTPNELERLSKGEGHAFSVYQVASASMKDGSVTLPLGTPVQKGGRMRFFVREGTYAREEVSALWNGYKKQAFEETFATDNSFVPTGCIVIPTLDRGSKLFGGATGPTKTSAANFESRQVCEFLPGVPSVSGFYSNGVVGPLNGNIYESEDKNGLFRSMCHGSASNYVVFGSKTKRPIYRAAAQKKQIEEVTIASAMSSNFSANEKVPRDSDGELIVKRREIHSGRALSVATVEWSVAENIAVPSSALEGFMWDKETEVDRFRERVPLSNLVSQVTQSRTDLTAPQPRNWIKNVLQSTSSSNGFVIIPECKRSEPTSGSLRKRYDVSKLASDFESAGVEAFSVNCDAVLFGGSQEDITVAREACPDAPILASDLILYPYQLYKLSLAGADAVNLVAGALSSKDLVYLTKIAKSIGMQCVVSVTSQVQLQKVVDTLNAESIVALVLSNRNLEDFAFDDSGEQALGMLSSQAITRFREKFGSDLPVLVEGRVGLIEKDHDVCGYIQALKENGASGAIIGEALAVSSNDFKEVLSLLSGKK